MIKIERYHTFGESKYAALEKQLPEISSLTDEQISEIIECIRKGTNTPVKQA